MSTPIGKLTPKTANITGKTYKQDLLLLAMGFSTPAGMFFIISWRLVMNCDSDISDDHDDRHDADRRASPPTTKVS